MHIDLIGYVNIIIGFINISLGILVFRANRKKKLNSAYSLCTLSMALWSWSMFFYDNPLILSSTFWLKVVYVLAYLMALAQLNFIAKFNENVDKKKIKLFFLFLIPFFIYGLYLLIVKDSVVLNTYKDPITEVTVAEMGKEYSIYSLPLFLILSFLFIVHFKEWKKLSGLKKKQSFYYLIGGILMVLPLLVLDFILPIFFGITEYYRLSTIGNIFWAGIMAYSIYNTRFLDVRLVVGKLFGFLFRLLLIAIFLFLFVQLRGLEEVISLKANPWFFIVIAAFLFLIIYDFAASKIESFIRNKYVYSKYDPVEELQKFSRVNSKELNLRKVLKNTSDIIARTVNPKFISMILFNKKDMEIIDLEERGSKLLNPLEAKEFLQTWENLNSNPVLVLSEMQEDISTGKEMIDIRKRSIIDFMTNRKIEIIFPFELKSDEEVILILGQKTDNSLYSTSDMDFLDSIAQNTNISVERAILYSELQDFNKTLEQKVNEQTQELQQTVLELEEARRKERDMLDIMGHELRTPATVVKLNASLLEKYIDSNPKNFKKYLDRIKNSIENEIRLIETLLSSAKLEGEKMDLNKERVSIPEQIESVIHAYEYQAEAKELKLISDIDDDTKDVFADRVRVVEIIDNLVSNAIKYTDEGSIIVKTENDGEYVKVSVIDTGKGIPKEEIPKLGTKFHRVEKYINEDKENPIVSPGGTGLGLYVVFALIEMMDGKIWVESQVGKGTTFFFTLPVYKGQRDDIVYTKEKDMFRKFGLKGSRKEK